MPTTDSYGQGVPYLEYTDAPDLKVLGEGIVDGLTPLSNMSFASATARDATITTPVEGMEAWLRDVNYKTIYDGTAWTVVATGTSAWTTLSLASGYAHNGNDNGNAQYKVINISGTPMVIMRGGISITYSGGNLPNSGLLLASALPTSARPSTVRTIGVTCSGLSSDVMTLNLDAEINGTLDLAQETGSTPPWISLNNVMYSL